MSLVLNSSGGGSVTIQEPTTASNRTLNLPDANGTVANLDSGGNLLVGATSAPSSEKLYVNGGGTYVATFNNSTNTSGFHGIRSFIQGNGNNTSTWHFAGATAGINTWFLYGNGTSSYSSDERLKKDIETTRDGYLDDIMNLRVVKYRWLTQEEDSPKELGLIAQEVEQVFPNLIQEHELDGVDGTRKNIKHSVMEFILIKAIQELKAELDITKAKVAALEAA